VRKLAKREDARSAARDKVERDLALVARSRAPYGAAKSEDEAQWRAVEARKVWVETRERERERKAEARARASWDARVGYKAHGDVVEIAKESESARVRFFEARLERALVLYYETKGEEAKTLDAFNWFYGRGLDANDGRGNNSKSLGYMLQAILKAQAPRALAELLFVALNGAKNGALLATFPNEALTLAIERLEDAKGFDLLADDELEQLEAVKAFVARGE